MASGEKRNRGLLVANIVMATLLVLASVGFGYFLFSDRSNAADPSSSQQPRQSPTRSTPTQPSIENRRLDPAALTEDEIFDDGQFSVSGRTYQVKKTEALSSCLNATYGTTVGNALDTYECSQVVRATVVDGSAQVAATIGLANMADSAGAAEVDELLREPKNNGAFTVMNAPDINEDLLTKQKILVDHTTKGHYIVFVTVTKLGTSTFDNSDSAVRTVINDCRKYLGGVLDKRTG